MAKYLYPRPNSPNWWFEMTIPEDVRDKFGKRRIRKTTATDSHKKASRMANIWADDLWSQIEKARSPDWDYHNIKAGVLKLKADGLSPDELDDIAHQMFMDEPQKYDAYERATNKTVILKDHLEGYLAWCVKKKNNLPKTIKTKRQMLAQFCRRFERLEKVTEYEVKRWTSERDVKGATQKSMRAFARDFYEYLGDEIIFKKLDVSVLDGLKTKPINSEHKEVISGDGFKQALEATKHKDASNYHAQAEEMLSTSAGDTWEEIKSGKIQLVMGKVGETIGASHFDEYGFTNKLEQQATCLAEAEMHQQVMNFFKDVLKTSCQEDYVPKALRKANAMQSKSNNNKAINNFQASLKVA